MSSGKERAGKQQDRTTSTAKSKELTALVKDFGDKVPGLVLEVAKFEFSDSQNRLIVEHAEILARLAVDLNLDSIKVGAIEIKTRHKIADLPETLQGKPPLTEEELLEYSA